MDTVIHTDGDRKVLAIKTVLAIHSPLFCKVLTTTTLKQTECGLNLLPLDETQPEPHAIVQAAANYFHAGELPNWAETKEWLRLAEFGDKYEAHRLVAAIDSELCRESCTLQTMLSPVRLTATLAVAYNLNMTTLFAQTRDRFLTSAALQNLAALSTLPGEELCNLLQQRESEHLAERADLESVFAAVHKNVELLAARCNFYLTKDQKTRMK